MINTTGDVKFNVSGDTTVHDDHSTTQLQEEANDPQYHSSSQYDTERHESKSLDIIQDVLDMALEGFKTVFFSKSGIVEDEEAEKEERQELKNDNHHIKRQATTLDSEQGESASTIDHLKAVVVLPIMSLTELVNKGTKMRGFLNWYVPASLWTLVARIVVAVLYFSTRREKVEMERTIKGIPDLVEDLGTRRIRPKYTLGQSVVLDKSLVDLCWLLQNLVSSESVWVYGLVRSVTFISNMATFLLCFPMLISGVYHLIMSSIKRKYDSIIEFEVANEHVVMGHLRGA